MRGSLSSGGRICSWFTKPRHKQTANLNLSASCCGRWGSCRTRRLIQCQRDQKHRHWRHHSLRGGGRNWLTYRCRRCPCRFEMSFQPEHSCHSGRGRRHGHGPRPSRRTAFPCAGSRTSTAPRERRNHQRTTRLLERAKPTNRPQNSATRTAAIKVGCDLPIAIQARREGGIPGATVKEKVVVTVRGGFLRNQKNGSITSDNASCK